MTTRISARLALAAAVLASGVAALPTAAVAATNTATVAGAGVDLLLSGGAGYLVARVRRTASSPDDPRRPPRPIYGTRR